VLDPDCITLGLDKVSLEWYMRPIKSWRDPCNFLSRRRALGADAGAVQVGSALPEVGPACRTVRDPRT